MARKTHIWHVENLIDVELVQVVSVICVSLMSRWWYDIEEALEEVQALTVDLRLSYGRLFLVRWSHPVDPTATP